MSSQELDKLFRDKLEELKKEPSTAAWSKVQGQMDNKGKKGMWFYLKVAAAILLLISFAGFFIKSLHKEQSGELVTGTENEKESVDVVQQAEQQIENKTENETPTLANHAIEANESPSDTEITTERKAQEQIAHHEPLKKTVTPATVKKEVAIHEQKDETPEESIEDMEEVMQPAVNETVAMVMDQEEKSVEPTTGEESPATDTSTGTTLVFDIEEFDMKTAVTAVYETAEETRKNGFRKIVDLIKSVKEGDGALAELRDAKNSLLVLNSKDKENDNSK